MTSPVERVLGAKIGSTRVTPLVTKIILIFALFILVSSLTSNYINLMFNRTELIKLTKELLVKDLKQSYTFSTNQFEIFQFTGDVKKSMDNIEKAALMDIKNAKAVDLGVKPDGTIAFQASKIPRLSTFSDQTALATLNKNTKSNIDEGSITFVLNGSEYFGVFKYNQNWDMFIVRAEELNELYANSRQIFLNVSLIIVAITLLGTGIGIILIRYILRYVGIITSAIMKMRNSTQMDLVDMSKAPNDEVTFLGVAFNALSSSINNLVSIFRKFVSKDIALKAYREMQIRLEGSRQELTILFSDIRSFTTMTETLGPDVIKLLNLHYERAIGAIVHSDGIIGSLIGDAVLAVFGTFSESKELKSIQAIKSAYLIQENAAELRQQMEERRERIMSKRGGLTDEEERVYRAVLLEVGVGIDGGEVFYGNIGSHERMTNTVIGDNVNSASRLEGLTRIYNVPVICSEFVKDDIQAHLSDHEIVFHEIDRVQVKGKTEGKRIFWALMSENVTSDMEKELENFTEGLRLYYDGDWSAAFKQFSHCTLPMGELFRQRTKSQKAPKDWNGVWAMQAK